MLNARMKMKYYSAVRTDTSPWVDRWVQAHQLLVNWNEAQADSVQRLTGTNWALPHGAINGTDANATMESTVLFQQDYPKWKYWDLSSLTQKWVNGTATNYGVILWATNENTVSYDLRFYSSSTANNDSIRPKLEVTWSQTPRTVYFLKDHLGSIRATVLDSATAPVMAYDDYDPWGYILPMRSKIYGGLGGSQAGTIAKNKFTGKEWDDEFGVNLYHFDWRPYDPQIGRWISRDPIAEKFPDVSPYQYAHNNPINRYDTDGKADFGSAAKLKEAGMKVIANPALKPIFDENNKLQQSFCNFGVCQIMTEGNDETLKGMQANDIFDYLSNEENAVKLSYEDAVKYANEGVTVILASKEATGSGHVAIVAPGEMVKGWGKEVPQVFNVGKRNELIGANYAFKKSNQPTAFILKNDKQSADARMAEKNSAEGLPDIFKRWLSSIHIFYEFSLRSANSDK